MKYHSKFSVFFIMLCIIFYSLSLKAGSFWEYNIHVCEKTDSFNVARNDAIKGNRKIALENVISKFISINDFRIVSKLLDEEAAYFFEDKIRLLNETINNNYYSIDITYYFNKNKILSFLNKNGIPYTTNLNNKVLFIVLYNGKLIYNNSWYNIWERIDKEDYLTNIVLLNNLSPNDNTKIIERDKDYLLYLKNTYKVDDVVIADLIDNAAINTKDVSCNNSNGNYSLSLVSVNDNAYQNFDCIFSLHEALKYSIGFSEIDAKNKLLSTLEKKNIITFKVKYNSFIDWVVIYNYLKQLPQVEDLFLSELDDKNIIIKIKYQGDFDNIIENASTHNILIDTNELSIICKGFCF